MSKPPDRRPAEPGRPESRGLFMMRTLLWYVFPKLPDVVRMTRAAMSGRDRLLVVQNWPPLDGSFVGKDVIPNHLALIGHLAPSFVPERYLWFENRSQTVNDHWFIGLCSPGGVE